MTPLADCTSAGPKYQYISNWECPVPVAWCYWMGKLYVFQKYNLYIDL